MEPHDIFIVLINDKITYISADPNSELQGWAYILQSNSYTFTFQWWKPHNLDYVLYAYKNIDGKEFMKTLSDYDKIALGKMCSKGYTWHHMIPDVEYIFMEK